MARLPPIFFTYEWRIPKLMAALLILEFPLTVACLALYGIADPNTYRTKLWQNGADQGFNSAPSVILYSYANYKPIATPMVWSSYMVQFNIAISVLSMFLLLIKSTMFVLHSFIPIFGVLVSVLELALYATSIKHQSTPDLSDPQHPSPGLPWYLSKGCKYATPANYGFCMQARAVFAVTCVMTALFAMYLIWSIVSMWPTPAEKAERATQREADIEMKKVTEYSPDSELSREEVWERNRQMFLNLPKTPNTPGFGLKNPMTPRTVAFTQLTGGENPGVGSSRRPVGGPSGGLKFREQYGDGRLPDAR
ncbi:hypothetical protein BAUCODRAFT_35677 [Baudoinia panamericana UAMH 10762]|uniref:Uncharacterized protein n=1 Tax=Baudoinia panamericana (strain UAMH 10762) TaxID=717646 RepID=M2LJQ7_BAUPA|nr:uncharacterized protein BAUCODRAFT_35677 [Baudoinia panamericana UAMH 10762]EMC94457.1 hypothetical protein BAUCODRAFT_35677 [Baudoinia panamericana UAMH 10762]